MASILPLLSLEELNTYENIHTILVVSSSDALLPNTNKSF